MPELTLSQRIEAAGSVLEHALKDQARDSIRDAMSDLLDLLERSEAPAAQPGRIKLFRNLIEAMDILGADQASRQKVAELLDEARHPAGRPSGNKRAAVRRGHGLVC